MVNMPNSNAGRPVAVSAEQLYRHLMQSRDPLTVPSFAEEFDVSPKTVRKRLDDLMRYPGVKTRKVGNTKIFWYNPSQATEDRKVGGEEVAELANFDYDRDEIVQDTFEHRAKARGLWLDRRQRLRSRHSGLGEIDSLLNRADLWMALEEYMTTMAATWPSVFLDAYDEKHTEEDVEPLIDLDDWHIDEQTFDYFTKEVTLFGSGEIGQLEGLAELSIEAGGINEKIREELDEKSPGEITSRLDELIPQFEEILQAGEAFDTFVCEMNGYNWGR